MIGDLVPSALSFLVRHCLCSSVVIESFNSHVVVREKVTEDKECFDIVFDLETTFHFYRDCTAQRVDAGECK